MVFLLERKGLFVCFCTPHNHLSEGPRCDPSAVLRDSDTPGSLACFRHSHLFSVMHSPHPKPLVIPAHEIFAIRCKCHCPYVVRTPIDFGGRGTLLSSDQHPCSSILSVRTGHCRRRGHQLGHNVTEKRRVSTNELWHRDRILYVLAFIDTVTDQCTCPCLVFSVPVLLAPRPRF